MIITIGNDYNEVSGEIPRLETKIRERLSMYRGIGLSDEAILSRMRIYKGRLKSAHSKAAFAGDAYIAECEVMAEVYRRLAEERGLI